MTTIEDLVRFWQPVARTRSRFHPSDEGLLSAVAERLAPGRAPEPFFGNLHAGRVFFLTFNPGHRDDPAENEEAWRNFCFDMMAGDMEQDRFEASASPASQAWLNHNLGAFAERSFSGLVNLRLFPYASREIGNLARFTHGAEELPSVRLMRSVVHDYLVPKARKGDIALLVMRSSHAWGFGRVEKDTRDGELFVSRPLRSTRITPGSRVGPLIRDVLQS